VLAEFFDDLLREAEEGARRHGPLKGPVRPPQRPWSVTLDAIEQERQGCSS
jgi:hypothetical protein